jgi:hypothetical protein
MAKRRSPFGSPSKIPAILANPPVNEIIDIYINDSTPYTGTLPFNAIPAYWVYQRRLKRSCPYPIEESDVTKFTELWASFFHSVELLAVECWGNPLTSPRPSLTFGLQCFPTNVAIGRAPPSEKLDAGSNANDAPYARQTLNPTQFFWTAGTNPSSPGEGAVPFAGITFTQMTHLRIHARFR